MLKRHIQPLLEKPLAAFPVFLCTGNQVIGLGDRRLAVPFEVALFGSDNQV